MGGYPNWEDRERNQAAADKMRYLTMVFQFIAFTGRAVSKQEVLTKFPCLNIDYLLSELGKMEPGVSCEMRTAEDGTEEAFYSTPPRPIQKELDISDSLKQSRKREILAFVKKCGIVSLETIQENFPFSHTTEKYKYINTVYILDLLESEECVVCERCETDSGVVVYYAMSKEIIEEHKKTVAKMKRKKHGA